MANKTTKRTTSATDRRPAAPRDPRGGRRGLDAPPIPGSIPRDAKRAAEEERRGMFGVKLIIVALVGTTLALTLFEAIAALIAS
ncbi:MAG: hypothetical protein RLZZ432_14 [Chloroflexota bacterium]|jgi:hypothetical protein